MAISNSTDPAKISLLPSTSADISSSSSNSSSSSKSRRHSQQRITLFTNRRKMSRRANLIGVIGVSSLCILLLIATSQHRPTMSLSSGVGGGNGGGGGGGGVAVGSAGVAGSSGFGGDRRHAGAMMDTSSVQSNVIIYNLTASIGDVLIAQRAKIVAEMENFEYPQGRFGVDAEKLSDMTPETGGTPVRSIVVTSWRSGSTFLGDILNSMPGNYYHYEPLLNFGIRQVREADDIEVAVQNLKNLLHCDYTNMEEYLEYGKSHTYLFEHNERLWSVCKEYPHFCWRAKFLTPFCKLFPMQSMKTVRLRLENAEELLKDKSLNVRVILLVRDPRGTLQSRKHRVWCAGNPDCEDPRFVCEDLVDDYNTAVRLLKAYPSTFKTLRYEDLSLDPYDVTQEVLQFYGLPFDPLVEEFLDTHTKMNIGGVSSTYRDSRSAPFHWKQDLRVDEIRFIQDHCEEAMKLWGYRKIENFTDFQRTFDPITLPPPLV